MNKHLLSGRLLSPTDTNQYRMTAATGIMVAQGVNIMDYGFKVSPVFGRSLLVSPCVVGANVNHTLPKIADAIPLNRQTRIASAKWASSPILKPMSSGCDRNLKPSKSEECHERDTIMEIRTLLAQNQTAKTGIGTSTANNRGGTPLAHSISLTAQNLYSFSLQSPLLQTESPLNTMRNLQKAIADEYVEPGTTEEVIDTPIKKSHKSQRKKSARNRHSKKSAQMRFQSKLKEANSCNTKKPRQSRHSLPASTFMIIKGATSQPIEPSNTPRTTVCRSDPGSPTKQSVNSLRSSTEETGRTLITTYGSRLTKVYCSEKLSGSIITDGTMVPCAPPVTPTQDMLKKFEYIPSMADIKSQRCLRLKLQTIEKSEKKKLDKLKREKAKLDEQMSKEKEKMKRQRQRQEIYALNAVMTKLEYDRFIMFCRSKGLNGELALS